jgi:exonuclease SbcC
MKIDNIRLTHFKRFGHVDLPLDEGFYCIVGPNGSGKSTLLNAIPFALYGVSGGLSADHIVSSFAEPGDRCEVELDFTYEGRKYNIVRTFKKNKSIQHDATIRCEGEIRATGVTQVAAESRRIIGLSPGDFDMVVYSKQDDLRAITDIRPGERKDWFGKAGGVNFIKTGSDKILKERAAQIEQDIATLRGELSALSRQDPAELEQTRKDLATLKERIAKLQQEEKDLSLAHTEKRDELADLQLRTVKQGQLIDKEDGLRSDIAEILKRQVALTVQLESLKVNEQELQQLEEMIGEIQKAREEIEAYRTNKASLDKLEIEKAAVIREQENVKARITKIDARLAECVAGGNELVSLGAKVCTALGYDTDKDPDDAVAEYRQYITEKVARIQSDLRMNEDAIKDLQAKLETLRNAGQEGACPICLQRLGDHFETVEKEYCDRIAGAMVEGDDLNTNLAAALKDTQRIPDLKPTLNRIRDIHAMLGHKENLLEEQAAHQKDLVDTSKKVMDLITAIEALKYSSEDHDACKQRLAELEAAQTRHTELTKRSAERAGIKAQIAELNSQVTQKNAALTEVKAAIDKDPINPAKVTQLTHEVEKLDTFLKTIGQDLATATEREKSLTQKVTDLEIAAARIGTAKDQLVALQEEVEVLKLTRAAIADYVIYIMQVMRSAIEVEVSAILSDITDGKYSRLIVDEEFNILIQEGEKKYTLDRYSGGEQDVIALALRMALSNILPKLHGVHETFPFLIDEGLASLDPERKENTIRALRAQSKRCGQVINNTHDQSVAGDHTLSVSTRGPVSTVRAGV